MPHRLLLLSLVALATLVAPAATAGQAYQIPPDNPFVTTLGAAPEVYAYGLRNPFRWSFDRQTGDMIIGDVGAQAKEEIDFLPRGETAGANLGWNCFEGTLDGPGGCAPSNARGPVYQYDNVGSTAVTGGSVVRDPALPSFVGRYLFADFYDGDVLETTLNAGGATPPQNTGVNVPQIAAIAEDGVGRLYAVSLAGAVSRLTESGGMLGTTPVGSFDQPIALAGPPGDDQRLFVAERPGRVVLRVGGVDTPFSTSRAAFPQTASAACSPSSRRRTTPARASSTSTTRRATATSSSTSSAAPPPTRTAQTRRAAARC